MYKIGHRKKHVKRFFFVLFFLLFLVSFIGGLGYTYITYFQNKNEIKQVQVSTQTFDPKDSKHNLIINTDIYSMELPPGWKQISKNPDARYTSTRWQNENRVMELYTDKIPPDVPFNKIIPITVEKNVIDRGGMSDNCSKFTAKISDYNLKVPSKWDNASFLCDLSNWTDNIIGVSDRVTGTTIKLTGTSKGAHNYLFVYTDRGIPEDQSPITTAINSLHPK